MSPTLKPTGSHFGQNCGGRGWPMYFTAICERHGAVVYKRNRVDIFCCLRKMHERDRRTAPSKTKDRMSSVSLLMGMKSNSGAADARATVTWPSAEVAARLSPPPNCSFMFQSFDSRIFESSKFEDSRIRGWISPASKLGDRFMAQSSPGWAILSVVTQGRRIDAILLQIDLQSISVPQYWPTLQTFSRCQLSKKYLLLNKS